MSQQDHSPLLPCWFTLSLSHVGSHFLYPICLPHSFDGVSLLTNFTLFFCMVFLGQMVPVDLPPSWVSRQTKIRALLSVLVFRLQKSISLWIGRHLLYFILSYRQYPGINRPRSAVKWPKVQILSLTLIPSLLTPDQLYNLLSFCVLICKMATKVAHSTGPEDGFVQ